LFASAAGAASVGISSVSSARPTRARALGLDLRLVLGAGDIGGDRDSDFRMERDRDLEQAQVLDHLVQHDMLALDLRSQRADRVGDVAAETEPYN